MNKQVEQIRTALSDPMCKSVTVEFVEKDSGIFNKDTIYGQTPEAQGFLDCVGEFFELVNFTVNFHDAPKLELGDLVMVRDYGITEVIMVNGLEVHVTVKSPRYTNHYINCSRHQLVLLEKAK